MGFDDKLSDALGRLCEARDSNNRPHHAPGDPTVLAMANDLGDDPSGDEKLEMGDNPTDPRKIRRGPQDTKRLNETWDGVQAGKLGPLRRALKGSSRKLWFNPDTGMAVTSDQDPATAAAIRAIVGTDKLTDGRRPLGNGWVEI